MNYVFCGEVSDLQVINLFLSIWVQDTIIKLRILSSPGNFIDTPYKGIRLTIQNYSNYKRTRFLSVKEVVVESDDEFLARPREEARYCDFEKLKTAANSEEELIKIMFISVLRALKQNLDY